MTLPAQARLSLWQPGNTLVGAVIKATEAPASVMALEEPVIDTGPNPGLGPISMGISIAIHSSGSRFGFIPGVNISSIAPPLYSIFTLPPKMLLPEAVSIPPEPVNVVKGPVNPMNVDPNWSIKSSES